MFCIEFQEYIVLALTLKRPYFWVRKVGMLKMVIYRPASFISMKIF